jgi:hypothetical protein
MKNPNENAGEKKLTKKQQKALKSLERSLAGMNSEAFWRRVLKKYSKHCDIMDEIRRKSLEKAHSIVLD